MTPNDANLEGQPLRARLGGRFRTVDDVIKKFSELGIGVSGMKVEDGYAVFHLAGAQVTVTDSRELADLLLQGKISPTQAAAARGRK